MRLVQRTFENGHLSDLVSATGIQIPPCRENTNIMLHFNRLGMFGVSHVSSWIQFGISNVSSQMQTKVETRWLAKVLCKSNSSPTQMIKKLVLLSKFPNMFDSKTVPRIDLAEAIISFIVPFYGRIPFYWLLIYVEGCTAPRPGPTTPISGQK